MEQDIIHSSLRVLLITLLCLAGIGNSHAVIPARLLGSPQATDFTISSFNKIISSQRLSGAELANRVMERGRHYASLFRYQDAISDYTTAINMNPNNIEAYVYRAFAHARLEQYPAAYKDYQQALAINPAYLPALAQRGSLYFLHGKYQQSINDFKTYLRYRPDNLYQVLWIYIAERYQRKTATQIHPYIQNVQLQQWPGALIELFLEEIDIQSFLKALKPQLRSWDAIHRCEAYYYLGQYFLLHGRRKEAVTYFQQAVKTRAKSSLEYEFAVVYLQKLNR